MKVIALRRYPFVIILVCLFVITCSLPDNSNKAVWLSLISGEVILFAGLLYAFSKNKIELTEHSITHKTLFSRKEIIWRDVYKSEFDMMPMYKSLLFLWNIESYQGKVIKIPLGHYSRKSMAEIAQALVENCPNALLESPIKNMALGKFPWYIF
jgi:hypothetical protein